MDLTVPGVPPGTLKRKLSTLDRPALGEGIFTFDVFGEDDSDNVQLESSRQSCKSKTRPPPLRHRRPGRTVATRAKPRGRVRRRSLKGVAASARALVSLQDSRWQVDRIIRET